MIAEHLIEKYDFSAAEFLYESLAKAVGHMHYLEGIIDTGHVPAYMGGTSMAELKAQVFIYRKELVAEAQKLLPFELSLKKSVDASVSVTVDHQGIDAPPPSKDWDEWRRRHTLESATRAANPRH